MMLTMIGMGDVAKCSSLGTCNDSVALPLESLSVVYGTVDL
jgi:hypothetical protein